jgi:hypothetical protein
MRLKHNPETLARRAGPGQPLAATLFSLALMAWSAGILPGAVEALEAADKAMTSAVRSGERFVQDVRLLLAVAEVSESGVFLPAAPEAVKPAGGAPASGPGRLEQCRLDAESPVVAPRQKKL